MQIYSNGVPVFNRFAAIGPMGPDGNPIGTIISYIGKTPPNDYLICDGQEYNVYDYPDLADFFEQQFEDKYYFGGSDDMFAVPNRPSEMSDSVYCIKAVKAEPCGDIYSEEERVIGRWIDGRPLYRSILHFTIASVGSIDIPSLDMDVITDLYGMVEKNKEHIPICFSNATSYITIHIDGNKLLCRTNIKDYIGISAIAFVEYTKTSD